MMNTQQMIKQKEPKGCAFCFFGGTENAYSFHAQVFTAFIEGLSLVHSKANNYL